MNKAFAAIDLKSFYASVECRERSLDPLTTNLVVADASRTDKTICLAISPSLRAYGLPGRARLFEVRQKVAEINQARLKNASLGIFLGRSTNSEELKQNPNLKLDFIIATPRMKYYLNYSSRIYRLYLKFVAPTDIFAYSIDEVFCDLTSYLKMSHSSAQAFVTKMISKVEQETGITATAGIGTNLFLAKVAMDILAKHTQPNSAGVRIAELDEQTFREQLWAHTPITDFWRVGRGYAKRLAAQNLYTMGDVARCSLENPKLLYQLFGVNAELLIDHAWGFESAKISDIKNHQPKTKSLSSGQVLSCPYPFAQALTIVKEMSEKLALDLVKKHFFTDQIDLLVEYDVSNHAQSSHIDHYGRKVPTPTHCSTKLPQPTNSTNLLINAFTKLFQTKANPDFTIRKITINANHLINTCSVNPSTAFEQTNFFTNYQKLEQLQKLEQRKLAKEHRIQKAVLKIRQRYGENAILRGTNFEPGATMRSRHFQIGGHKA